MELGFQILAAALVILSAYFYFMGNSDGSLISGVFASCSFFISYRFRLKTRLDAQKAAVEPVSKDTSNQPQI